MQRSLLILFLAVGIIPSPSYALQESITISDCEGNILASEVTPGETMPSVTVNITSPDAREVALTSHSSTIKATVINKSATFLEVAAGQYKACTNGSIESVFFGENSSGASLFQMASIAIGGGAVAGGLAMAFDEGSSDTSSLNSDTGSFAEKGPGATSGVGNSTGQATSTSTSTKSPRPFAAEEDCLNDNDAKEIAISPSS